MSPMMRVASLCLLVGSVSGCASRYYAAIQPGTLKGKVTVEWYKPNLFVYRPDVSQPLSFVRHDGTVIRPELMYTDGGSIPRAFWVFRNYSPWGYGPAFVVHDWLFHMQNCKLPGYTDFTVKKAAVVMSEVMKTLMQTPNFDYGSKASVYLMYKAVQTEPAVQAWNDGQCVNPAQVRLAARPDATITIEVP